LLLETLTFLFPGKKISAKGAGGLTGTWHDDTIILMPKVLVDTGEVYGTQEAADLLGMGYATIYRWIKAKKIIPLRIVGRTLIPKSEVERLKKERATTNVVAPLPLNRGGEHE
jgi:excisionase family DNA binding protein